MKSHPGAPLTPYGRVVVLLAEDGLSGALVAVTCSSERLARSGAFEDYAARLCRHVLERAPVNLDELARQDWSYEGGTVAEAHRRFAQQCGETVRVKDLARYANPEGLVWGYVHPDGCRGVLMSMTSPGPREEVRRFAFQLGGQILVERTGEVVIGEQGPEERFDPALLLGRPWSRDPAHSVAQALEIELGEGARIDAYVRLQVGR